MAWAAGALPPSRGRPNPRGSPPCLTAAVSFRSILYQSPADFPTPYSILGGRKSADFVQKVCRTCLAIGSAHKNKLVLVPSLVPNTGATIFQKRRLCPYVGISAITNGRQSRKAKGFCNGTNGLRSKARTQYGCTCSTTSSRTSLTTGRCQTINGVRRRPRCYRNLRRGNGRITVASQCVSTSSLSFLCR